MRTRSPQLPHLPRLPLINSQTNVVTQRRQHKKCRNQPTRMKKPRTFGLYLITKTSQQNITSMQISLSYKVLNRSPDIAFRNVSSIRCDLLPVNFLCNDNSARDHPLPREISIDRIRALIQPSPHIRNRIQPDIHLKWKSAKWDKVKSPELQVLSENYQSEKMKSKLSNVKPFLYSKPLRGIIYDGSRLKFFYNSLYECNFPAIKYVLEREPSLVVDAIEPNTGYSVILIALSIKIVG
ncbi:unnamed protein product [Heterobilharzia americana]|nr:unnamed protein product [Heterobilharzia americana]